MRARPVGWWQQLPRMRDDMTELPPASKAGTEPTVTRLDAVSAGRRPGWVQPATR